MEERQARRLGRALFPIVQEMKEKGEWKSSNEIDWRRTAEALAPHVLRFREERRAQQNAQNPNEKDPDSEAYSREHGFDSPVLATKKDSN